MAGRVGDDDFGRTLLDNMQSAGVDMGGVALDPSNSTGVAVIMVDGEGQNLIAEVYGANRASDESQLEAVKRAMEGADALMLQLETPPEVSLAAARHARSLGVRVVWDPAPAAEMPEEGYGLADFLTPNETEAAELTGIRVTDASSAQLAAEALLARGAGAAIVKMGYEGVFGATRSEHHYIPPMSVDAVDSVAAGDAFAGGLTVALCEGKELCRSTQIRGGGGCACGYEGGRTGRDAVPTRGGSAADA